MATILIADDDAHIREVVQYALEREGYQVQLVTDGEAALARAAQGGIDLIVLDILMPELDGIEVCRRLRTVSLVPVIFLTSKGDEIDRIVGLELGADDYLAKPFSPRELVARVRAVLRRQRPVQAHAEGADQFAVGPTVLDVGRHELTCHGKPIQLTVTEFAVLEALLRRPGHVLTRGVLVEKAYNCGHHITERTIDTHIRRIRAKFRAAGHDPIETVHGLGYKARAA